MRIVSNSIKHKEMIPLRYVMGKYHEETHVTFSDNVNPHIAWVDVPEGTKSFALACIDRTVPSKPDDVNQEGRFVPEDLPRVDFYHWLLTNIPPEVREIREGEVCRGVTAKGKPFGESPHGFAGINDYTSWFKGDESMEGLYGGYDGPCPPWNDSLIHEYDFIVFALDVPRVDLPEEYYGTDLMKAIDGHVLEQAELTGYHTINPKAK